MEVKTHRGELQGPLKLLDLIIGIHVLDTYLITRLQAAPVPTTSMSGWSFICLEVEIGDHSHAGHFLQ